MRISISRRGVVVAASLAGITVWSARTQAAALSFKVALTGAQQVPPVQTTATGTADLTYDPTTRMLTWSVTSNGLSGPATMAHFDGPAAEGKNASPVIWLSEKGGPVPNPIKGSATLTPEQAQQFMAGEWYVNVHTQADPGGEIRGQVMPPKS
jgi:CHRD domain